MELHAEPILIAVAQIAGLIFGAGALSGAYASRRVDAFNMDCARWFFTIALSLHAFRALERWASGDTGEESLLGGIWWRMSGWEQWALSLWALTALFSVALLTGKAQGAKSKIFAEPGGPPVTPSEALKKALLLACLLIAWEAAGAFVRGIHAIQWETDDAYFYQSLKERELETLLKDGPPQRPYLLAQEAGLIFNGFSFKRKDGKVYDFRGRETTEVVSPSPALGGTAHYLIIKDGNGRICHGLLDRHVRMVGIRKDDGETENDRRWLYRVYASSPSKPWSEAVLYERSQEAWISEGQARGLENHEIAPSYCLSFEGEERREIILVFSNPRAPGKFNHPPAP